MFGRDYGSSIGLRHIGVFDKFNDLTNAKIIVHSIGANFSECFICGYNHAVFRLWHLFRRLGHEHYV